MRKKQGDKYLKVVEWSEEDGCYVGTAPGLIIGGVHGKSQSRVFAELCQAVEEAVRLLKKEGCPLPAPTADKKYSGRILLRIPAELHKALTIRASQAGESLNKLVQHELESHLSPDQAYFWTPRWQDGEKKASEDIRQGRTVPVTPCDFKGLLSPLPPRNSRRDRPFPK